MIFWKWSWDSQLGKYLRIVNCMGRYIVICYFSPTCAWLCWAGSTCIVSHHFTSFITTVLLLLYIILCILFYVYCSSLRQYSAAIYYMSSIKCNCSIRLESARAIPAKSRHSVHNRRSCPLMIDLGGLPSMEMKGESNWSQWRVISEYYYCSE